MIRVAEWTLLVLGLAVVVVAVVCVLIVAIRAALDSTPGRDQ